MDGTKVRANNSKKSNYSPKKIERHLAYIEEKTNEYLAALEQNDLNEKSVEKVKNICFCVLIIFEYIVNQCHFPINA